MGTTCSTIQVNPGDGCDSLAARCGITEAQFTQYNSASNLCTTLVAGQYVCCSSGSLPNLAPQPNADGSCSTYFVKMGDTCSQLAVTHPPLTVAEIISYNADTWGWLGCDNQEFQANQNICLSSGTPPFPAPVAGTVCGPQVPNTPVPPAGTNWSTLNPCPLNACCDKWGQCGVTSDFCTPSSASSGAPGTSAPGQNGCISNCGSGIVNNNVGPAEIFKVGYFEAFNLGRDCLNQGADELPSGYTHIHFAFANISSTYEVDVTGMAEQWELFVQQTGFKRIVSFGGWAFSTDTGTYDIFRQLPAHGSTLIASIVAFVDTWQIDGVDIDWEYPGEPDIKGIPPGSLNEGGYYLTFLQELRAALPEGISLSIAAPASYWYLQGFPIAQISNVVDYIVYMTYDLHGQWDYSNIWDDPGCPTGGCLRSHVNLTETLQALSLITKAGVPSNKIVVGIASYARSFQMVNPSCTGPECLFTGPLSGATPGSCTQTAGYISNAELNSIINNPSIPSTQIYDSGSDSNILVYEGNWAAYMGDIVKQGRIELYTDLNFLGTSDWAIDLQEFIPNFNIEEKVYADVSDWRTHSCMDTAVNDSLSDPGPRWLAAGCDDAWADFLASWDAQPFANSSTFTNEVSNFFNGRPNWQCAELVENAQPENCLPTFQCDNADDFGPAAQFIMDSMAMIFDLHNTIFGSLFAAEQDISTVMDNFVDTFAPPTDDSDQWFQLLLNILGLAFSVGVVPLFNKFLGEALSDSAKDAAKNAIVSTISFSVPIISAVVSVGGIITYNDQVEAMLGKIVQIWATSLHTYNEQLFAGSPTNITTLWNSIDGGTWIAPGVGNINTTAAIIGMENALLSFLIPYAWEASSVYPFLMDTGLACGTTETSDILQSFWMSSSTASATIICYDNQIYHLVAPIGYVASNCQPITHAGGGCSASSFSAPTGLSTLDGTTWGSLTYQDLAISALEGYFNNGKQNGWSQPSVDNEQSIEDLVNAIAGSSGTLLPGQAMIPVCNASVAFQNWDDVGTPSTVELPNFPCNPVTIVGGAQVVPDVAHTDTGGRVNSTLPNTNSGGRNSTSTHTAAGEQHSTSTHTTGGEQHSTSTHSATGGENSTSTSTAADGQNAASTSAATGMQNPPFTSTGPGGHNPTFTTIATGGRNVTFANLTISMANTTGSK